MMINSFISMTTPTKQDQFNSILQKLILTLFGRQFAEYNFIHLTLLKYLKENDYSVIAMRDLNNYVDVKKAMNLINIDNEIERIAEINTAPDY